MRSPTALKESKIKIFGRYCFTSSVIRSASFCGSWVTVSAMLSYTISLPMALTSVKSNSCK